MALDQVEERHDGEGPVADLVGQRRQRKVYPLALEACTLAVERDTQGGDGLKLRILAKLNLERQIGSESATWLDRELISRERLMITDSGFGRELKEAPHRRAMRLVEMGYATAQDGAIIVPARAIASLEQCEVERVGRQMATERGSGRFAMIEDGLGFTLVPRQPVLDTRVGQHIAGIVRDTGGIAWSFGRKRGVGL